MATIRNYFSTGNRSDYIDYGKYLNLFLVQYLSNTFLNGGTVSNTGKKDLRVVYSDNSSAFRKRSDDQLGNIDLPFINFIQKEITTDDEFNWYNTCLDKRGEYIPELETTVRLVPIQISYECTFWCALTNEMRYIANQLAFFRENHTDLELPLEYDFTNSLGEKVTVTIPHYLKLNFTNLTINPEYERNAWLEENIKHSVEMDFTITTWGLQIDSSDVSITEKTILHFTDNPDLLWRIIEETL